jgi:endo-1,4-beta-xylanase
VGLSSTGSAPPSLHQPARQFFGGTIADLGARSLDSAPEGVEAMTYTFKRARHLALSQLDWLAAAAVVISACSAGEPTSSTSGTTDLLVAVQVTPKTAIIETNKTIRFYGKGADAAGDSVAIAIEWAATGGMITTDGVFSASTAGGFRVIGKGKGHNKSDTSDVTVVPPQPTLTAIIVTPAADTLAAGASVTFTAAGRLSDGSIAPVPVVWSATGGTIDAGGRYTAGTSLGQYRVICANPSGTVTDTAAVSITAPQVAQVVLIPATTTVTLGGTQQFTAYGRTVNGDSIVPPLTYAAGGGTITAAGMYTAGATPGTYRVTATHQGGIKADTALVTVTTIPPTGLGLITQPGGAISGVPFTPQPVVELRSAQNQPVQRSGVVVTVSKASGTGSLGGTLSATTNTQGRATFAGLQIIGTGPHTIVFAAPGLSSVTSATLMLSATTLRSLATARGFSIGAAVRDTAYSRDAQYRQTLLAQYNSIVPEDATDFYEIHASASGYNFAPADALVSFAQANGMAFHGHSLVWYRAIPTWVTAGGLTDAQVRAILKDHITTVVSRYRGKVASWDVVNEPLDNQGCFNNQCGLIASFWLTHLGAEYIDSAFVWAHRADPAAKLYLNEFRTETIMNKSDALLALAQGLKARGVPIDGVGFQVHILKQFFPAPTSAQVQANFQRFADAGFDIRITEMDVAIPDAGGAAELAAQATIYSDILNACLKVSRCIELTTWGFSDRYNWVPKSFPGYGRALPFDSNYQPKPALNALLTGLGQR